MPAAVTDKFLKVGVAGTLTTLQAPGKALAAASINIGSATNWPTDTGVLFAIRQVDSNGDLVAGTYTEWVGTVSGTTISGLTGTPAYGSDQVYAAGSTTQVYIPVSAYAHNRLIDGLLVEHDQDGTHGTVTATSVTTSGSVTATTSVITDTVAERTAANGVTVDGLNIKDGALNTASSVTNTALSAGMVAQVVSTAVSAVATGTTTIPADDTIPQNTEGDQYITLAITPKSTTNILVIEATLMLSHSAAATAIIAALFQDTTANALAAAEIFQSQSTGMVSVKVAHTMTAGTTSATTFKIRAGGHQAGTTTLNGSGATRRFGAINKTFMKITEYKA